MKSDLERLLLFLVPTIFIEKLLQVMSDRLFAGLIDGTANSLAAFTAKFPGYSVGDAIGVASTVSTLIGFLPTIAIAVWLWQLEKRKNGRHILWSLGALTLNYWILLLFVGYRVYEKCDASRPI